MRINSLVRRIALHILSQPKTQVKVTLQQVNFNGILSGKNIVITGGSRGIGFAMAQKFV